MSKSPTVGLTDEDRRKCAEIAESPDRSSPEHTGDATPVSVRECALMRCMKGLGVPTSEIEDEQDRYTHVVDKHTNGRCDHASQVPVPPTVYQSIGGGGTFPVEGELGTIDEEKTDARRERWRKERENDDE